MAWRKKWKSLKDIQHILDNINSTLEMKRYNHAAGDLAVISFHYLLVWGYYDMVIELWKKCIDHVDEAHLKLEAHNNIGLAYKYKGEWDNALSYLKKGLKIANEYQNKAWIGSFHNNMGIVYSDKKDHGRAIEKYNLLLKVTRETGDRMNEGLALGNIGYAYYCLEKYEQAIDYCTQHIKIAMETGDRRGEGNSHGNIGAAYYVLKKYEKSIEHNTVYLQIAEEINDREGRARANEGLAEAYAGLKQYDKASDCYKKSLSIWRKAGNPKELLNILENVISFFKDTGDNKKVKQYENELKMVKCISH